MIIRSRPKYIDPELSFSDIIKNPSISNDSNRLYFSSGGDAFEFFLMQYISFYKKQPNVGIQTLTCPTMVTPILNTDAKAHLFDINLDDLGLCLDSIKQVPLDIVVLTSYQGIPSAKYKEIADFCKLHNILLFEDLAHGIESYSDKYKLGTLSNVFIESFCWDKPYAAIHGGSLNIIKLNDEFEKHIVKNYANLPCEPKQKAIKDCKAVLFGMKFSEEKNYYDDFPETAFFKYPFFQSLYSHQLFSSRIYRKSLLLLYKILEKFCASISDRKKEKICRLHPIKIAFIDSQRKNFSQFDNQQELYDCIEKIADDLNIKNKVHLFGEKKNFQWNRFSFLDESDRIKTVLKSKGICCGNYNWTKCIHELFSESDTIVFHPPFSNAENVSRHIVNVPIWKNWWHNFLEENKIDEYNIKGVIMKKQNDSVDLTIQITPPPHTLDKQEIETSRLLIRRFRITDFNDYYEYKSNDEVMTYQGGASMNPLKEFLKFSRHIRKNSAYYAVELKEEQKVIGNIFLKKDNSLQYAIGYIFNKKYWKNGYAKESIHAILNKLKSDGIYRVYAEIDETNIASKKLVEKLGFSQKAVLENQIFFPQNKGGKTWHDKLIYDIVYPRNAL